MFANIFEFVSKTTRIAGIEITNPERLVYPNHRFTKLHLVEYYVRNEVASASESQFCISGEQFDSLLREARRRPSTSAVPDGVSDLGTYEVVEGDLAQGYAHLFFSGRELHGDIFLVRSGAETGRWTGSRKPQPFPIAATTGTTLKRRAMG